VSVPADLTDPGEEAGVTAVPMSAIDGHALTGLQDRAMLEAAIDAEPATVGDRDAR
jgi:predicted DsbA family dithiol-disulfide isomerase